MSRGMKLWAEARAAAPFLLTVATIGVPGCGGSQTQNAPEPLVADPPAGAESGADEGAAKTELQRGIAYVKAEKYADALPHLQKAVQTNPKNAEAAYYLALAKEKTG